MIGSLRPRRTSTFRRSFFLSILLHGVSISFLAAQGVDDLAASLAPDSRKDVEVSWRDLSSDAPMRVEVTGVTPIDAPLAEADLPRPEPELPSFTGTFVEVEPLEIASDVLASGDAAGDEVFAPAPARQYLSGSIMGVGPGTRRPARPGTIGGKAAEGPAVANAHAIALPSPVGRGTGAGLRAALPAVVHREPPRYPARAVREGIEGRVLLVALVRANGSVESLDVVESSGHSDLDEEAMRTVRTRWVFSVLPDESSSRMRRVEIPIRFQLRSAGDAP